jgi:YVTN family beta-propeller protein
MVGSVTTGNSQPDCCGTALGSNPSKNYMYECRFSDHNVYVMSGTTLVGNVTRACSATQPLGVFSSSALAFNPSNNEVYVLNPNSNSISVISGATLVGNVTVGSSPSALAFNPSNNYMYVANFNAGTISVISGSTVVNTIPVGSNPSALAFDSSNNYMYVSNFGGTVSVIEGDTPVQATQNLVKFVNSMNLSAGITTSLDTKLNDAISSLNSGHNTAAKGPLNDFISYVKAQAGKGITTDQANALSTSAQVIINSIP